MATQVEVPPLGESITQGILIAWHKADGQPVAADEPLCELETDKANVDIPAPSAGVVRHLKKPGDTVSVGEAIATIETGAGTTAAPAPVMQQPSAAAKAAAAEIPSPAAASSAPTTAATSAAPAAGAAPVTSDELSPAVRRLVEENHLRPESIRGTGPSGRITKEDVLAHMEARSAAPAPNPAPAAPPAPPAAPAIPAAPVAGQAPRGAALNFDQHGTRRVAMSKIRRRIAETLVQSQQTTATLTTFNEIDMSAVLDLRNKFKDRFQEVHGVGLGFMSFFARAVCLALNELPHVNAFIDGNDIIYHNYVNLGIAVSTERGLAVPVLRNAHTMSFARIEAEVKRLANATRDGKLSVEELSGGTFTITNGGVFGSLLSTPILNPPQSGILGMHAIQKRAVVINDRIEVRPMMYVALSYDHRIVDGREAITFLVRVKQLVEDPTRVMLEV